MMENNETRKETKVLENDQLRWMVPECCREGLESCRHVINRPKKAKKGNIGL